jgi:ankyrin repeat protein
MFMIKKIITLCTALFVFTLTASTLEIHQAAQQGDKAKVESLLKDIPLLVNAEDDRGRTPIFYAAMGGYKSLVESLIERGALVKVSDSGDRTPLHFAASAGHIELIELLVESGAVVNARAVGAATPLYWTMWSGQKKAAELLISLGADLEVKCNAEITPVYVPVYLGNKEMVEMLLGYGVELNYLDFLGRTPLQIAVERGYAEIAELLIEHGAEKNVKERDFGRHLLHLAAINGHKQVTDVLLRHGAKVNARDDKGYTPLANAIKYGHKAVADMLLEKGGRVFKQQGNSFIQPELDNKLKNEGTYILKLRGGSWAVKTKNQLFVFCYMEEGKRPATASLTSGYLNPAELKGQKVYFFHPVLRFQAVFEMEKKLKNIVYIMDPRSKKYVESRLENDVYLTPGENKSFDSITISALPGWGGNQGYYVNIDGLGILWIPGIGNDYIPTDIHPEGIDYVFKKGMKVDLLIMSTPYGLGPEREAAIKKIYTAAKAKLHVKKFLPMGSEALCRNFCRKIKDKSERAKVLCVDNAGDGMLYKLDK